MSEVLSQRSRMLKLAIWIVVFLGLCFLARWWFYARFYEYTNDAYVNGNQVFLTPQVGGIVTSVFTDDTDFVIEGKVLVQLDTTDAQIALDLAAAHLGQMVREVCQLFERVAELEAMIKERRAVFMRTTQDFEHRTALIDEGAVSLEDLEHAEAALEESFSLLDATEHQYTAALAQVNNTTIETHPLVEQAQQQFRQAYVNLKRCTLLAPTTGIVAQRNVQVGKQVTWGEPLLAIVPLDQMWIDGNFKEVQLSGVRVGQPVKINVDLWGGRIPFTGTVVGIAGGTGSIFSVLPPQNATGNWIKIVQRLPVRVALKPEEIRQHPLRLGLSCEVTIDIHNKELLMIPKEKTPLPIYQTDALSDQEEGVETLIAKIIEENLGS